MSAPVLRVPYAALACVLIACCCWVAVGEIAMDCCLEVKNKVVPKEAVVDYFEQVEGQGCAINAVILVTRNLRKLCILPTQPTLNQIKKHVDKLKNHCRKTGYEGRRCYGVKRQ